MYNKKTLKQGFYHPQNPEKYKGDVRNIIFRSGLELKYMRYFDINPNILQWNSEEIYIPYKLDIDGSTHRYFIDFWVKLKDKNNEVKEFLIEIKPYQFTIEPTPPITGKITKSYKEKCFEWVKNQNKWKYAQKYAENNGMKFIVLTEKDL